MISAMPSAHRACTLLSALLLAFGTSCASDAAAPTSQASSAQPASTVSSPPTTAVPPDLALPAVTPDEISRTVYLPKTQTMSSTARRAATAGRPYTLDAACLSASPGRVIRYEVLSTGQDANVPVASGDLPCDGSVIRNSMPLPATGIQVNLGPDLTDVTAAYAVIAPST